MSVTVYKYQDSIADPTTGRPVASASITVKNHSDGTLATLYDEAGEIVQVSPVLTDSLGHFFFYAPVGVYDLTCSVGNMTVERTGVFIDGYVDLSGGVVGFATRSAMEGDLAHPDRTIAWVTNDPTPANNGTWRKEGAGWVQSSFDRVARLENMTFVSDAQLRAWTNSEAYEITGITWGANGFISSATVKWPDGSAGTLLPLIFDPSGTAINSYRITHGTSVKKVTQPEVTRDASLRVTIKPELIVEAI